MKATELKLGDWASLGDDNPVKIAELELMLCSAWDKDENFVDKIFYEDLKPIPLTTEILEKNGWEKQGNDYIKENDGLVLRSVRESFLFFIIEGEGNKYLLLNDIDYVHQLQHLLWALEIDNDLKI